MFFTNAHASGSSFNTKRKLHAEGDSDDESQHQAMFRVKSPPLKRRATFPVQQYQQSQAQPQPQFMAQENVPDLMTDCSNSASNSDEDMAMDQDMEDIYPAQASSPVYDDRGFVPRYDYEYGMSGSGGIGFGPGAEEDDDFTEEMMESSKTQAFSTLPSLTPHTNPNHFSNVPPYTSNTSLGFDGVNASGMGNGTAFIRASSPLSAQSFSTTLRAPNPTTGLIQPMVTAPLPFDANPVERARAVHGPNCKSIPKLMISPHPDPLTGKQSMYSMCPDCGSCERAA